MIVQGLITQLLRAGFRRRAGAMEAGMAVEMVNAAGEVVEATIRNVSDLQALEYSAVLDEPEAVSPMQESFAEVVPEPSRLLALLGEGYKPMILPGCKLGSQVLMTRKVTEPSLVVTIQNDYELAELARRFRVENPRRRWNEAHKKEASTQAQNQG